MTPGVDIEPSPVGLDEPGLMARAFQLPVTPALWRRARHEGILWVALPLGLLALILSLAAGAYRAWQSEGVLVKAVTGYDQRFDTVVYERGRVRVLGERVPRLSEGDVTMLVDPDETVPVDEIGTSQYMVVRADRIVMRRNLGPQEEVPLADLAELLGDGPIVIDEFHLLDAVERWAPWIRVAVFALVAGLGFAGDLITRPVYAMLVAAVVQPWLSRSPGGDFLSAFKVALATSSTTLLVALVLDLGGAGVGCSGPFLWPALMLVLTMWAVRGHEPRED